MPKLLAVILAMICLSIPGYSFQGLGGYSVITRDSIQLDPAHPIFSESALFKNNSLSDLQLQLNILYPEGWRAIGQDETVKTILLHPGQQKAVVLAMLPGNHVHAGKDSLQFRVCPINTLDTANYSIHFYLKPHIDFSILQEEPVQFLTDSMPENLRLGLRIHNTGNDTDHFFLSCENEFFHEHSEIRIALAPGMDTMIRFLLPFTKQCWQSLHEEDLFVRYKELQSAKENVSIFKVSRPRSTQHAEPAPGNSIPITFGGGLLAMDNKLSYFGKIETQFDLGLHHISFYYRSKDFGNQAISFQPNVFNLSWSYKQFLFQAGQITGPRNFYTNGQGLSLLLSKPNSYQMGISGMKYLDLPIDPRFKNDHIYAYLTNYFQYFKWTQRLETGMNTFYGVNSYLLQSELEFTKNKHRKLSLYLGSGYEDDYKSPNSNKPIGFAGGYNLAFDYQAWTLISNLNFHSNDYPGIFKGQQVQRHEICYRWKDNGVGLTYISNSNTQSTLLDTVYRSDFLSTNITKYGLFITRYGSVSNGSLRLGFIHQTIDLSGFPDGKFTDLEFCWNPSRNSTLRINSNNAFQTYKGQFSDFSTNSSLFCTYRRLGFTASYNRFPLFSLDNTLLSNSETINAGPNFTFAWLNRTLCGNVRLSIAKTISESILRPGFGAQINYHQQKAGIDFGLSGYYPMYDPVNKQLPITEVRNGTLYLYKRILVPIHRNKLFDLNMRLFEDKNHNGIRDKGEGPVCNTMILVNNRSLMSDEEGRISYLQTSSGVYTIDLLNANQKGLIPENGWIQKLDLATDLDMAIPFCKGQLFKGSIRIIRDSLSSLNLTEEGFKIIITDSSGKQVFAVTDRKGAFRLYLMKGIYTVSLNPSAFAGSDYQPDFMSRNVELSDQGSSNLEFTIRQKKRLIRFLDPKVPKPSH